MQVISSLLNLQAGSITDGSAKSAVLDSQSRVKSMSLIHQLLYENDKFTSIDFHKYLEQLMITLHDTFGKPGKRIIYQIDAESAFLDIEKAIPLGLVTNELVTNAYKYAFPGVDDGFIQIRFRTLSPNMHSLSISDSGIGLPPDLIFEQSETLGLKLVRLLTEQINGTILVNRDRGTEYIINFRTNPISSSDEQS